MYEGDRKKEKESATPKRQVTKKTLKEGLITARCNKKNLWGERKIKKLKNRGGDWLM